MTDLDTTSLKRFSRRRGVQPVEEWNPPVIGDFRPGWVVGIDQSLGNCGIVVLCSSPGALAVLSSVTLRTQRLADGPEDTLLRTEVLRQLLRDFLYTVHPDVPVRHEMPLLIRPGMKGQRPESSWLAAGAVRAAAADTDHVATMMSALHHKKVTANAPYADKREHHGFLMPWAQRLPVTGLERVTNVDERDAFSIAMTHLLEDD